MRYYKVIKENHFWWGYEWDLELQHWNYISDSVSFSKLGCKHFIKKYHKKTKEPLKEPLKENSEEFALE